MLASPSFRSWRPVSLGVVFFVMITFTLYSPSSLRQSTYEYPRYVYDGISNYISDRVYENTLYRPGNEELVHQKWNFSNPCGDFPETDGILLVMKTGATEAFDKIPTHLLTSLQCLPDFLLFSDMEQQIGQWHIYDALDSVTDSVKEKSAEFNLYKSQLDCPVSQKACVDARGKDSAAWALDKYKFLHMMMRAWTMRPNQQWYVFAEADTYIFWPNLVTWLRGHVNHNEKLYVGSVTLINNFPFAHGGSGYVISGVLLKSLVEDHPDVAAKYDLKAKEHCCGDLLLGMALEENEQVKVKQAHPMFNGEKPATLPFGPSHWCEPIFTMHHMNSEEISAVWQYEQTRIGSNDVLIMKHLYQAFVARNMDDYRKDWDNLSDDVCYIDPDPQVQDRADGVLKRRQKKVEDMNRVEKDAHRGWEQCAKVCEFEGFQVDQSLSALGEDAGSLDERLSKIKNEKLRAHEHDTEFHLKRKCFQWRYKDGVCCTAKSFKLGAPRRTKKEGKNPPPDKPEEIWHSGWYQKGIEDWIEAKGECKTVAWKKIR